MPRMDGFEATRRIREMNAAFSAVPVVAMTANVQKSAMEQCQSAGMNDYLSKPIKLGVLREALGRWLTPEEAAPAPTVSLPPRSNSNTVVDKAFLDDLRQQIGPAADRMVGLFLEDLPGYIDELRAAAGTHDMSGITRVAHTLKGAAGNVGANRLAQRALALEQEARSGVRSACENLVSSLVYEANLVRHVLEGSSTSRPAPGDELKAADARQSRILVVDDDRASRFALRETLLGEGYEVAEAANGQQAVEICRQTAPDLVVMDGMMPVDEVKARLNLPDLPAEGSYHTLGGLILALLRRLPSPGDRIVFAGWRFEVLEMDGRRVERIRASLEPATET